MKLPITQGSSDLLAKRHIIFNRRGKKTTKQRNVYANT